MEGRVSFWSFFLRGFLLEGFLLKGSLFEGFSGVFFCSFNGFSCETWALAGKTVHTENSAWDLGSPTNCFQQTLSNRKTIDVKETIAPEHPDFLSLCMLVFQNALTRRSAADEILEKT